MAQGQPQPPPAQPAGSARGRAYKDHKIYMCFALNRIVAELGIDIYQPELEAKIDAILAAASYRVTKEDVKHEIRSNHFMTEKVLQKLQEEGLIQITQVGKEYQIRITKPGVLHVRKFNEFYKVMYREQILQHYAYRGLPWWFK
jgi:predicted transcriptional regulator